MAIELKLSKIMKERNISLNELSKRVGVSTVNLSRIRTGRVNAIRFSTLNAICKVLRCQPGDIIKYDDREVLERQYCASAFTIDFQAKKVLLVYNEKLQKWLQPGGHIEGEEEPCDTAVRETFEETGINIKIVGPTFDDIKFQPVATERYINFVGDMIDIQFLAIPKNIESKKKTKSKVHWFNIDGLDNFDEIEDDIKNKVFVLYETYKDDFVDEE